MATAYYANQYFTTQLSVTGGIDDSQTTAIVVQSVTGIQNTAKPGIALINYSDPLNETLAEWVTFTSINSTTKTLVGVTRGTEKGSAKSHDNGVTVAFPISESHINPLVDAVSIGGVATNIVSTTLDQDDMASNSATALATQQSIKAYVDTDGGSLGGWTAVTDTWVYASATTITIAAGGASRYQKGDKLKLTQTTVKYFYIVGVADTLLTITGGSDYTLADAAITSPFLSRIENPFGFPSTFNFAPGVGGFSSAPSFYAHFNLQGTLCTYSFNSYTNGTSNATTFTATAPIVAKTVTNKSWRGYALVVDNGTVVDGSAFAVSGSATITVCKAANSVAWTNSGNKSGNFTIIYEI